MGTIFVKKRENSIILTEIFMPSPFFFSFFSFFIGVGVNYKSYFKKNKLEDIRGDN
jgi:hypothetical protein